MRIWDASRDEFEQSQGGRKAWVSRWELKWVAMVRTSAWSKLLRGGDWDESAVGFGYEKAFCSVFKWVQSKIAVILFTSGREGKRPSHEKWGSMHSTMLPGLTALQEQCSEDQLQNMWKWVCYVSSKGLQEIYKGIYIILHFVCLCMRDWQCDKWQWKGGSFLIFEMKMVPVLKLLFSVRCSVCVWRGGR